MQDLFFSPLKIFSFLNFRRQISILYKNFFLELRNFFYSISTILIVLNYNANVLLLK